MTVETNDLSNNKFNKFIILFRFYPNNILELKNQKLKYFFKSYFEKFEKVIEINIRNNKTENIFEINIQFYNNIYMCSHSNGLGNLTIYPVYDINYYIKILNFPYYGFKEIFNIFSCFRNIQEIIFNKLSKIIYINFQSFKGAFLSKKYLNNLDFHNDKLKIYYFKIFEFNYKLHDKKIFNGVNNRFSNKNNYKINSPSKILFFENICNKLSLYDFYKIFLDENIKINKIRMIKKKLTKNFLLEYQDLESSIQAWMKFHNFTLNNKEIKANFSHFKFK